MKSRMDSNFGKIRPGTAELAALERLEKSAQTYNGRNVVTTLVPSFLDSSSSFLQVTRATIQSWMSFEFKFGQIQIPTTELAALECLKNQCIILWPLNVCCCPLSIPLKKKWYVKKHGCQEDDGCLRVGKTLKQKLASVAMSKEGPFPFLIKLT